MNPVSRDIQARQIQGRLSSDMVLISLYIMLLNKYGALIANEQAERRRSACEAASLMPHEVLQRAEKFSIVL